jgi:hypothetical protein
VVLWSSWTSFFSNSLVSIVLVRVQLSNRRGVAGVLNGCVRGPAGLRMHTCSGRAAVVAVDPRTLLWQMTRPLARGSWACGAEQPPALAL